MTAILHPQRYALGLRLHEQGRYARAARIFASLDPDPDAGLFHALCLNALGENERAIALMERVIEAGPDTASACYTLARLYEAERQRGKAEQHYRRTVALDPSFSSAWLNLGNCLTSRGAWDEGIAAYTRALELAPHNPGPLTNLALTWLLLGDYQHGWRLYHERWSLPAFRARNGLTADNAGTGWSGQDIRGRRLVVFREQGTGDVIQMLRYDEALRAMGADVIWRVPAHLFRLARASVRSQVVTDVEPLPPHDYIVPVMSLPLFCETFKPSDVPKADGYLCPELSATPRPDFTVGVAWAGSPHHKRDPERSIGIEAMSPLFTTPGVRFVNLQFGDKEQEGDQYGLQRVDVSDYYDTAQVLRSLDLVIAVDTSIVHLAGGMSVPCWVMVTAIPDFRWLLGRSDSAWYRSVTVYRQPTAGDWVGVVEEVKERLTAVVSQRRDA